MALPEQTLDTANASLHAIVEDQSRTNVESEIDRDNLVAIIRDEITKVIRETVNGKIDKIQKNIDEHNAKHEKDMERIMPALEAFESTTKNLATIERRGKSTAKVMMWIGGFVTVVGGAWLTLKSIFGL